jgi:hypothetical protein
MRKIGLLLMVLVLSLGALGVGYAAWTDTITIDGTVNTGSVDLEVVRYSGTWVYKMPEHSILEQHGWVDEHQPPTEAIMCVAYAEASMGANNDIVTMTFDNLFPGETYCADFLVHYVGSVPAMVGFEGIELVDASSHWWEKIMEQGAVSIEWLTSDVDGTPGQTIDGLIQMHYCDYAILRICITIPQDNSYQNAWANFTGKLTAVNWNEADHVFD